MAMLNQALEFNDIPADARLAFTEAKAEKVVLPAGTLLFRFSGHSNLSPWWSEVKYLPGVLLSAKLSKKNLYEYVRKTNAVLRKWDPNMSNLIIAKLNADVYSFRGSISPQNEAAVYMDNADVKNYKKRFTKPVFFGGGNSQVYIKGLSDSSLSIIVPAAAVNIFDDIDAITDFLHSYGIF